MLKKILFRESTNFQFIFATAGALIGLTALLLSLQLIMDVRSFHSNEEELFGPNTVVIQKKVTKLTTIGMNSTEFTKKEILNIESRDDRDIFKLYNLAHQHYQEAGGINEIEWINLYRSFLQNTTDVNFDLIHPGKQSNLNFYNIIKQKINLVN